MARSLGTDPGGRRRPGRVYPLVRTGVVPRRGTGVVPDARRRSPRVRMTGRGEPVRGSAGNMAGSRRLCPAVDRAITDDVRGACRVLSPARGARRRADHRRGTPLQPAPDHPRRRDDRPEAAEERQGAGHRRRRPRQPGAALPGRGRRRHASASRSSTRSTSPTCSARSSTASPTSGSPRRVRRRSRSPRPTRWSTWSCTTSASTTTTCCGVFEGYDLIVDGTDNFATRYMVNDAAYFLKIPYVWGSIYRFDGQASVFWPTARRAQATRPATAASTPSRRRRAWSPAAPRAACWACCARQHRLDPGQRGDQAAHRHRRAAGRQADDLRRPRDGVPQAQGPQGPQLRAVRREPHGHRADRLRDLLRRDLRGGGRRRRRLDDLGDPARAHAQGARERRARLRAGRRARAQRVRDQPDPRLGADPQGRVPQRQRPRRSCPYATSRSCCTASPASARPRRWRSLKGAGYADAVHVGGGVVAWVNQIDPTQPSY